MCFWPMWSIAVGLLTTAVTVSLSVKSGSEKPGNIKFNSDKLKKEKQKAKKQNHCKSSWTLSAEWKGVNKMTVLFAAFMVSVGIPGRDSKVCG